MEEKKIIDTETGKKNGTNRCPSCGSTDIAFNIKAGKLQCRSCRNLIDNPPALKDVLSSRIEDLNGITIGSGAKEISKEAADQTMITLKCPSCGAEVVIDSSSQTSARCHWCRSTLSLNAQVPNGAVPDAVLPFKVTKEEAESLIRDFAGKRKFYAHPKFRREFNADGVMGVYLPYMMISENTHVTAEGEGEIKTRSYTVTTGTDDEGNDITETRYDADRYHVRREFDMYVKDLTIESSEKKLDRDASLSNNVINAIMPFDTENALVWNAAFLKGYTSEKRDVNTDDLKDTVQLQTDDIGRNSASQTTRQYDRGVHWYSCDASIKGQQWLSAYLPVWIFSYQEVEGDPSTVHYIAVNGRTKETVGSVPLYYPKLVIVSVIIGLVCFAIPYFISIKGGSVMDPVESLLLMSVGALYFFIIYSRYRSTSARHDYEAVTKRKIANLQKSDEFLKHRKGLRKSKIEGENEHETKGNIY